MRSTLLLTAALALGVIASPFEKRYMVTEVELVIRTVTVLVPPGLPPATLPVGRPGHPRPPRPRPIRSSSTITSTRTLTRIPAKPSLPIPAPPPLKKPSTSAPKPKPTTPSVNIPASTPKLVPAPTLKSNKVSSPVPTLIVQTSSSTSTSASSSAVSPRLRITGVLQANLESGIDYQNAVLYHHNAARANHGALALEWDSGCEANAKLLAQTCVFKHYIPKGAGQGQNLEAHSGEAMNVTAAITEGWYKGEFAAMTGYWGAVNIQGKAFEKVGHLTQMLWKGSTHVGCTSWNCPNGILDQDGNRLDMTKFTVCNYAPAGNVVGGYAENVGNPISTSKLGNWYD